MIKVYHGSIIEIQRPQVAIGRDNLDFGKAFYVTRLKEQAERWARVVWSRYEEDNPILNVYNFDLESVFSNRYRILTFDSYDKEWLEFIVASRRGLKPWMDYDLIEGGVANDRVIDTLEGFMAGDFSADVAIGKLKYHKPNNQIAILNQQIIDEHLHFSSSQTLTIE